MWYVDGVAASAALTVTVTLSGAASASVHVAEMRGTAAPSLDGSAANSGDGLVAVVDFTTASANDVGFMAVAAAYDGNQTVLAGISRTLVSAVPLRASPAESHVAGAALLQALPTAGPSVVSAAIYNSEQTPVNWAAIGVGVRAAPQAIVVEFINNASLDIILLQQQV